MAVATAEAKLSNLYAFFKWVDKNEPEISQENVVQVFKQWTRFLIVRYSVRNEISHETAYSMAVGVAWTLSRALGYEGAEPSRILMDQVEIAAPIPKFKKRFASTEDKQRSQEVLSFGALIMDVCLGLTSEVMRGELPVIIPRRGGGALTIKVHLKQPKLDVATVKRTSDRHRALSARARLAQDERLDEQRPELINLRVQAEMLLFISQTGMNLTQAARLQREHYRWQTDGDELNAFRVYKGRRKGEAIFRCYKVYRQHLEHYINWLDRENLSLQDRRMFPFLYHKGKVPAEHKNPTFDAIVRLCEQVGIRMFLARALRKFRANWLLRHTNDIEAVAALSANGAATLIKSYVEPDHRRVSVEIREFHNQRDPTATPPGPGDCVGSHVGPKKLHDAPQEAPQPDCISTDGCLFCQHHRDVMSFDYCLKLASHYKLKSLEALLAGPSKHEGRNPVHAVLDRIEAKLRSIEDGGAVREIWIRDAKNSVSAGEYHEMWSAHIELFEVINGDA